MVKPFEVLKCADYGDAGIDPWSHENSHEEVYKRVHEIADAGVIPIILGRET
jgi:arginase family enzyme